MDETKIVKLSIFVSKETLQYRAFVHLTTETKNAYKFDGRLIKKTLFGKIDTIYQNTGNTVSFYTWVLPESVNEFKVKLLAKAREQIELNLSNAQYLMNALEFEPTQKVREQF